MTYSTNLFILNEAFGLTTNGLNYNLLDLISLMSILCGVFVIVSKNPVVSVLFLIGLFLNISGYLMLLGIHFIGLSYLLVYVGAVSILFLFILMLINVRISELVTDTNNSVPLALIIGLFIVLTLSNLLPQTSYISSILSNLNLGNSLNIISNNNDLSNNILNNPINTNNLYFNINDSSNELYFVSSQIWDGALAEVSHITSIGNVIYTVYPIWLILTSIILLLAMVGAIVITIKQ